MPGKNVPSSTRGVALRTSAYHQDMGKPQLPDAFVSHSTKDKNLFVRPLVECLAEQGTTLWYDEYSMHPGDSLSTSIDKGLSEAKYGLVVISPDFIRTAQESGWTRYELRGITSNSIGPSGKGILPIWLDVTRDEVRGFSPSLADLLAIDATEKHIEQVALEVLRIIAPERSGNLSLMRLRYSVSGKAETFDPRKITPSPPLDRRVGGHIAIRSLLVSQALSDCGNPEVVDFSSFVEDLSADIHPENELRLWEAIAASYVIGKPNCHTPELRNALFRLLLSATLGPPCREAYELLTSELADPALKHFRTCLSLARGEVMIGAGGLRGLVKEPSDTP